MAQQRKRGRFVPALRIVEDRYLVERVSLYPAFWDNDDPSFHMDNQGKVLMRDLITFAFNMRFDKNLDCK